MRASAIGPHSVPAHPVGHRVALALAAIAALWPVWFWIAARVGDGSDEAWQLVSLATAAVFVVRQRVRTPSHDMSLALPTLLLLFYAASYAWLSPLPRAGIALTALAALVSALCLGRRLDPALCGLMVLSLPMVATLDFYLGYPLRALVGSVTAALLQMNGLAVVREGTLLNWGGTLIAIDAPCSGVKMLWVGLYVSFASAAIFCLRPGAAVLLAGFSAGVVIAANIARAAALFYVESGLVGMPEAAHEAIGLFMFALAAIAIVSAGRWLAGRARGINREAFERPIVRVAPAMHALFLLVCAIAALLPKLLPTALPFAATDAPPWPTDFEGRALRPLPLTSVEERFQNDFPGRIGRFTDGEREIILRWVARETRKLHPAADCFKGSGYRVTPRALAVGPDGERWGSFEAVRGAQTLVVRERVYDAQGNNWTDVSSWYWAALWGRSQGPWWAVTIAHAWPSSS